MSLKASWLSPVRGARPTDMNDHRLSERHSIRVACRLENSSTSTIHRGYVTDISLGGCYVRMERPFLPGTKTNLTILLSAKTLAFRSIVRHAKLHSGMGLEFIAEDKEGAATALLDWLRQRGSKKNAGQSRKLKK